MQSFIDEPLAGDARPTESPALTRPKWIGVTTAPETAHRITTCTGLPYHPHTIDDLASGSTTLCHDT